MRYTNGHFYSLNQYLRETFGTKVYKLALDGGFTCPNRDGTLGSRGCIFCSEGGSGEFAQSVRGDLSVQIDKAKALVSAKAKTDKYIAYFQSFTNTYAPVSFLEGLFMQAIERDEIAALSVATRPDCLPNDVLDLLDRLNGIKPVWVELGLQTIHEESARYIRRGYPLSVYDEAVRNLRERNIDVITHIILGLPYESREQMLDTVRYAAHSGIQGIKLQLLHVLENTDLADEYRAGRFSVLEQEEYIDILCECIELLPKDMVIHRLTGDGAKRLLIAPMWSGNKKQVLNSVNRELERRGIVQGARFA